MNLTFNILVLEIRSSITRRSVRSNMEACFCRLWDKLFKSFTGYSWSRSQYPFSSQAAQSVLDLIPVPCARYGLQKLEITRDSGVAIKLFAVSLGNVQMSFYTLIASSRVNEEYLCSCSFRDVTGPVQLPSDDNSLEKLSALCSRVPVF